MPPRTPHSTSFDVSANGGSGVVAVMGPPGSGKSHAVLTYLAQREHEAATGRCSSLLRTSTSKTCYIPLKLLRPTPGTSLSQSLAPFLFTSLFGTSAALRRNTADCGMQSLANMVQHYFSYQPEESELHIVLDDVDMAGVDANAVSLLQRQLPSAAGHSCILWCISRGPVGIPDCSRYHFIARPNVDDIMQWLSTASVEVTPQGKEVADIARSGIRYYMTRRPMSASVIAADPRLLLQCVSSLLPALRAAQAAKPSSALNDMDFSKAWSVSQAAGAAKVNSAPAADDIWLRGVRHIGVSATLVSVAAFYCGVVQGRHSLGGVENESEPLDVRKTARSNAQMSASANIIRLRRLLNVYSSLARMVKLPAETVATQHVASHFVWTLVDWGLLVTVHHRTDAFKCMLPLNVAIALADDVGIKLMDLLPVKQ